MARQLRILIIRNQPLLFTFTVSRFGRIASVKVLITADTTVFDLVGITNPTTQTGISAGLSVFTWICQIVAVFVGKRVGRKTILLWVWPILLLGLVGLCVSRWVFDAGRG